MWLRFAGAKVYHRMVPQSHKLVSYLTVCERAYPLASRQGGDELASDTDEPTDPRHHRCKQCLKAALLPPMKGSTHGS